MPIDFKIRRAGSSDTEILATLNAVAHGLHIKRSPTYFKQTNVVELRNRYKSLLVQPSTRIWIAEVSDEPIGYVVAQLHDSPEDELCRARRWWEIDEIAVEPAWQRKGIGDSLVQNVIAEARAQGASEVQLTTWCFNEQAQQAFVHMGFTVKSLRYWMNLKEVTDDGA